MYQAIETKFAGPTNSRGSRVLVKAQAGRMTVAWDNALNVEQNHLAAAQAFATKMGWGGRWRGGANAAGTGFTFVCNQKRAYGCEDPNGHFDVNV